MADEADSSVKLALDFPLLAVENLNRKYYYTFSTMPRLLFLRKVAHFQFKKVYIKQFKKVYIKQFTKLLAENVEYPCCNKCNKYSVSTTLILIIIIIKVTKLLGADWS